MFKNILSTNRNLLTGLFIAFLLIPSTSFPQKRNIRPNLNIFFPQLPPPKAVEDEKIMLALNRGKLILKNGCLRLYTGATESSLLIWPGWFSFDVEDGVIYVMYTRLGITVARMRIGDTITVVGGGFDSRATDLIQPIPKACVGPYWLAGGIDSIQSAKHRKNSKRHFSPR
jgi:hypothetical protein